MARGVCVNCGKPVGGLLQGKGYFCPGCGKCYCADCGPKVGKFVKRPVCPTCGRELRR